MKLPSYDINNYLYIIATMHGLNDIILKYIILLMTA